MHEKPDIPNYGKKGKGELIVPGMVFCIEPMINLGTPRVSMDADNWTIRTLDRKPSAHFEHQIAITEEGTEILSTYQYIEDVLAN
jgi:methionyl aminopeptidase